MANQHINVYKNEPTAGAKDGTLVSTDGTFTSPISFPLSRPIDSLWEKLAIRTEPGFKTTGETIIEVVGDTNNCIFLYWDKDENGIPKISTNEPITDTNKIFYARASTERERPGRYTNASIQVKYKIVSAN